jgi:hypothetical protein
MQNTYPLYLSIFCDFWGEKFSPKKLHELTDLQFRDSNEVGDMGRAGIRNFGSASLHLPDNYNDLDINILNWFIDTIEPHSQLIRDCGCEDLTMWIMYALEGKYRWEFSNEQIKKIADWDTAICLGATEADEDKPISKYFLKKRRYSQDLGREGF